MASAPQKPASPVFTSYKPLIGFLNGFRDDGHVPLRVDKSHLSKASGSVALAHLHALKYLKLIDEAGKPLPLFEEFVMASDTDRPGIMARMLRDAYPYMFNDADFDLARASSKQVEERFRQQSIQGSTVIRAISFFLSAAKDAGIKLAPGLKAPSAPARSERKAAAKKVASNGNGSHRDDDGDEEDADGSGGDSRGSEVMKFEIPIPVNRKVKIMIPSDFDDADWTLLQTMFNAYVTRWKAMPASSKKEAEDDL